MPGSELIKLGHLNKFKRDILFELKHVNVL